MMSKYNPCAYIVVFAVDERATLEQADRILLYLKMSVALKDTAVILVANKTDLVRSRIINTQGKKYFISYLFSWEPANAHF